MAAARRVLKRDHRGGGLPLPPVVVLIAAFLVPGSGHVLLGRSLRGLVYLFWMIIMGYLTWQLSNPGISFIGRISGGLAVWVLSMLEVYRLVMNLK